MIDRIINELYRLSKKAYEQDEVPVACVIVKDGKIVSKAYNKKEKNNDLLGHAEILAIRKLCKKLNNWRLDGYEMYVTLKPCAMCMEVIKESRIDKIYYILDSLNINNDKKINIKKIDQSNDKFKAIITSFFKEKR